LRKKDQDEDESLFDEQGDTNGNSRSKQMNPRDFAKNSNILSSASNKYGLPVLNKGPGEADDDPFEAYMNSIE
jgi:hypothetical protein